MDIQYFYSKFGLFMGIKVYSVFPNFGFCMILKENFGYIG